MAPRSKTPSLLWRHSSGTLLAGSAHLLPERRIIPDWLVDAFEEKPALVLECQWDEVDPDLQHLPARRSLDEFIRPRTQQAVSRAAEGLRIPVKDLESLKPYACALRLVSKALSNEGIAFEHGADAFFYRQAQDEDKSTWGLEDPRTVDALLGSMDLGAQDEYLFRTATELDCAVSRATSLIDAWYAADFGMFESARREMPEEVYQRLVVRRNEMWTDSIIKGVREAPETLILVGSLHLIGPDSLLRMLAQRGLSFERVRA